MSESTEKATARLKAEAKTVKGRYELAVKKEVMDALFCFIGQSDEFARAIEESSGNFGECLSTVVKDIKGSLSDIEAYRRAVAYYFPGAEVEMKMTIRMSKYEKEEECEVTFSLFDLL